MVSRRHAEPAFQTRFGREQEPSRRTLSRGPLEHAFLIPVVLRVLTDLDVGASLWQEGRSPEVIHDRQGLLRFDVHHRAIDARQAYNDRSLGRMRSSASTVLGEHGGLHDLFVPVRSGGNVVAALVAGPFFTTRPGGPEILERWRLLTGRTGHVHHPEFAAYVSAVLETLVLEGRHRSAFTRLLELLSALMSADGSPEAMNDEILGLREELAGARAAERSWEVARAMVDVSTSQVWSARYAGLQLRALGMPDAPAQLCAGLFVAKEQDSDPLDELLRRHSFQRTCVDLARGVGGAMSGRIGEQGVTFLCAGGGPVGRTRRKLLELADGAARIARRRFRLVLHVGVGDPAASLPAQYQSALEAAGQALSHGVPRKYAASSDEEAGVLGRLRRELRTSIERSPEELPARFEELIEAVAARAAHQPAVARAHLENGFEPLIEALMQRGTLETRSLVQMRSDLRRAADEAATNHELFAAYRRAVSELADAIRRPAGARHERNLGRAEDYVREHFTEPVRLRQVAKIAGFEPTYFSRLFHKKLRKTFARYLLGLRVARARELLATTRIGLSRIAELSGFSSAQYLCRVHKRLTLETPDAYRRRAHVLATRKD